MLPIEQIAERLGIPAESLEPYGRYKAKVALRWLAGLEDRPDGKLVLVTAVSPRRPAKARPRRPSGSATRSTGSASAR